jgi:imidazolonepropionase-like amidohydrolase
VSTQRRFSAFRSIGVLLTLALPAPAQTPESQPAPDSHPATQPATQPASRPGESQPSRGGRGRRSRDAASSSSSAGSSSSSSSASSGASTSSQAAEKKDTFLAVINGRVHTVTGPLLHGATILCKNDRIVAIGNDVPLPQECEVVDARDRFVYPGLVASGSAGILGAPSPEDSTDLFSLNMNLAMAAGITTTMVGNDVAKVTFGSADGIMVRKNVYYNLSYSSRSPLEKQKLRAEFERVRGYNRDLARHELEKANNKDAKPPDKEWLKGRYDELRKLMAGETIAVASANTAHELQELAELAEQYRFRLVVRGAAEGWIVADTLGRAGVSAVVTPRTMATPNDDAIRPTGSTIENARILHDAGVPVAIAPLAPIISVGGLAGRDLLNLNMEAAFAVRGGMADRDALESITITPARMMGVDSRVGSLEVGKDADILVTDGDILYYMTQVQYCIVNGRVAYDKSKDTLFGHIRPTGKHQIDSFDDQWPKKLEWRD